MSVTSCSVPDSLLSLLLCISCLGYFINSTGIMKLTHVPWLSKVASIVGMFLPPVKIHERHSKRDSYSVV